MHKITLSATRCIVLFCDVCVLNPSKFWPVAIVMFAGCVHDHPEQRLGVEPESRRPVARRSMSAASCDS